MYTEIDRKSGDEQKRQYKGKSKRYLAKLWWRRSVMRIAVHDGMFVGHSVFWEVESLIQMT